MNDDDSVVSALAGALDIAVLERLPGGDLAVVGNLPRWCPRPDQVLAEARSLAFDLRELETNGRQLVLVKPRDAVQNAKSQFLSLMHHEIRTPLNAVIGMADVLAATPLTADQQRSLEVAQRNCIHMLRLMDDLLELSLLETGKLELHIAPFSLRDVAAAAVGAVESMAISKGLSIEQRFAPGLPIRLMGDATRLRQILLILLNNAVKFTTQGGIVLQIDPDALGHIRFAVEDSGPGVPDDRLGAIFEGFTQGDDSSTRAYGGAGLGLTIAKRLVERMGGRIWVQSTEGIGSTFFFTAALGVRGNQFDFSAPPTAMPVSEVVQLAPGLRILLADDAEDSRGLVLSYLRKSEALIDVAEDGQAAINLFRNNLYDVVVMDVEMPIMDGFMATREIRSLERERGMQMTPILALTAHDFSEIGGKGFEAGFTDLLTKPIRKVELLKALSRHAPQARFHKLRVHVQDGMEDVVPQYIAKRRAEIAGFQKAAAAKDFEILRAAGHRLKGTGAGYGFPRLTQLGVAMEQAAKEQNADLLQEKLDELERYLGSLELEYSK